MVGNWRKRKESGVDMKEGAIKVSVLKAVLFLWRGLKPPVVTIVQSELLASFSVNWTIQLALQSMKKTSIKRSRPVLLSRNYKKLSEAKY